MSAAQRLSQVFGWAFVLVGLAGFAATGASMESSHLLAPRLFGIFPVWGALALIAFLILATAWFHNFLLFKGEARNPHLYFTLVNTALAGAMLMIIGFYL